MALTATPLPAPAAARLTGPWAGRRLLLVIPHPDDESLATGGLIQQALRQGGSVRLLLVTDGDNNPWPQRWLERRWRIGATERRRWGQRRGAEMLQAMARLGLGASTREALHWPDLGVTGRLFGAPQAALASLVQALQREQPDCVVFPALADSHPDHSACHVLTRLALAAGGRAPTCLTYHVHGRGPVAGVPLELLLDARMRARKQAAVLAHASQVALARRRLLARVGPHERLYRIDPAAAAVSASVRLPWRPPARLRRGLRLTLVNGQGVCSWPWPAAPWRRGAVGSVLAVPAAMRAGPLFAHLQSHRRGIWIFDRWGWCDLTAVRPARKASA